MVCCLATHAVVEPKAKKKYKTKKGKEKEFVVEELVIIAQTMVGGKLCDEKGLKSKGLGGGGRLACSTKI
jgi:hypothetical protein